MAAPMTCDADYEPKESPDDRDFWKRSEALRLALQYHNPVAVDATSVVQTAETFLGFLTRN